MGRSSNMILFSSDCSYFNCSVCNVKGSGDRISTGELLICSRHLALFIYLISQQSYEIFIPTLQNAEMEDQRG